MAEECFPSSLAPMYCPSLSMICGMMINSTLIYEEELVGVICANMSSKVGLFLGTALNHSLRADYNLHCTVELQ